MTGIKRLAALGAMTSAAPAWAHTSEGGFVLLLPTDLYAAGGVIAVAATVILLALLPGGAAERMLRPVGLMRLPRTPVAWRHVTSLCAAMLLVFALWAGQAGPRDPLANPLPLLVWSVFWIAMVTLQGLLGNHWRWTSPWTAPAALLRWLLGPPVLRYPRRLGHAPAIVTFLGFAAILLADVAPSDPARLAGYVAVYAVLTLGLCALFGPAWLVRGEGLTVLMRAYARVALVGRSRGRLAIGLPGWRVMTGPRVSMGLALFMVILLGTGSFDGLNETFWWFGRIGINPLEFPGRSAVIGSSLGGLLGANIALLAVFALSLLLGLRLAGSAMGLAEAFRLFAPALLPIALGYHVAHYLSAALVEAQYALAALNDPLARGQDLLGLGQVQVTTGFFNEQGSVRRIFLAQAGAVVLGHVTAILLAHALAVRAFGTSRRAALSQAPLAIFMIAYTLFGLWLLASPRGV
ncbi:hypothetical protein ATO3_03190 [Marinibacterium profundimaris]|uniref:Fenitrothion hydrolase n=2 Tax=Marinibacterium profundimaris TaxID=1679460 RepID=A0A225NRX3_9RHOB|nr:hypothetical protein ATO3_03190 [Marinibacterium profundimaris]